jgi:hypothetical protein
MALPSTLPPTQIDGPSFREDEIQAYANIYSIYTEAICTLGTGMVQLPFYITKIQLFLPEPSP